MLDRHARSLRGTIVESCNGQGCMIGRTVSLEPPLQIQSFLRTLTLGRKGRDLRTTGEGYSAQRKMAACAAPWLRETAQRKSSADEVVGLGPLILGVSGWDGAIWSGTSGEKRCRRGSGPPGGRRRGRIAVQRSASHVWWVCLCLSQSVGGAIGGFGSSADLGTPLAELGQHCVRQPWHRVDVAAEPRKASDQADSSTLRSGQPRCAMRHQGKRGDRRASADDGAGIRTDCGFR